MPRASKENEIQNMTPIAKFFVEHKNSKGLTWQEIADAGEIDVSQLYKIVKSYKPQYASFKRPGYHKTELIGIFLGDRDGALIAAGYNPAKPPDSELEPNATLSSDERELVITYRKISPNMRKILKSLAAMMWQLFEQNDF